jgi:hypothetical protein
MFRRLTLSRCSAIRLEVTWRSACKAIFRGSAGKIEEEREWDEAGSVRAEPRFMASSWQMRVPTEVLVVLITHTHLFKALAHPPWLRAGFGPC